MPKSNGGSRIATRDEFLGALKGALAREELYLQEIDKTVLVWELTAPENLEYREAMTKREQRIPIGGKRGKQREMVIESRFAAASLLLISMALKDVNGKRQYEPSELVWMPSSVLVQIDAVAKRLSKLEDEDLDEGKGASGTIPDLPSSSRSPSPVAASVHESSGSESSRD